jgi:hypothetical protein
VMHVVIRQESSVSTPTLYSLTENPKVFAEALNSFGIVG